MNHSSLNGATINGGFGDTSVRSEVNLIAVASIVANARVIRRSIQLLNAQADIGPVLGRVKRRSVEVVVAQAAIAARYSTYVRFSEVCQAFANIALKAHNRARNVASLNASAAVTLRAHNRARFTLVLNAVADITAKLHGRIRSPVNVLAQALIQADGRVKPRTKVYSPVGLAAQAQIDARGYVKRRNVSVTEGVAQIDVTLRGRIRDVVVCYARADILAQADVYRRIPFDRHAPDERTYVVPAIQTYYVVN